MNESKQERITEKTEAAEEAIFDACAAYVHYINQGGHWHSDYAAARKAAREAIAQAIAIADEADNEG